MSNYAILIVAAGASRRLGRPKQLLAYKSGTLLDHTIEVAQASALGAVYVVLGSGAEDIQRQPKVTYLINEQWASGMGTSIACGVKHFMRKEFSGLVLMTCDQPFVSAALLRNLAAKRNELNKGIVHSDYGVGSGPPTFFSSEYFERLALLSEDEGAKSIVAEHLSDVAKVSFPEGKYDVDTEADLDILEK